MKNTVIDLARRLPGNGSFHGRSVACSSYPVKAGTMKDPKHCGMQGQCEFNKAIFAGHIICSEPICFSHFVEATGCMKWLFQDEANWLLMKSVLKGVISPSTTVR